MNVEPEDINLMVKLLDYALLSFVEERESTAMSPTQRQHREGSDNPSNDVPPTLISNDSAVMETPHSPLDPLSLPEELDWPSGSFYAFPEVTNGLSFFGRPWSTHLSEGTTYLGQYFGPSD